MINLCYLELLRNHGGGRVEEGTRKGRMETLHWIEGGGHGRISPSRNKSSSFFKEHVAKEDKPTATDAQASRKGCSRPGIFLRDAMWSADKVLVVGMSHIQEMSPITSSSPGFFLPSLPLSP